MSIRIMTMVWDSFPGGGSDLLSMLALADWSDDDGRCYPSMAAIASKTRLSRSQAQRVVHGLIAAGYLTVTGNETGGAPGSTRQYRINVGTLRGRMDATPTGRTDATGSAHATGRTDAQEGSHGCAERGRTDATQTVSEPSITVSKPTSLDVGRNQAKPDRNLPACPHQEIIALYAEHLSMLPQPRVWEGQRAKNLKTRWAWALTAKTSKGGRYATDAASAVDFFRRFFSYVANSDFLTGRDGKWHGCDLGWLVKAENFAKVLEGKYENRQEAAA